MGGVKGDLSRYLGVLGIMAVMATLVLLTLSEHTDVSESWLGPSCKLLASFSSKSLRSGRKHSPVTLVHLW